MPFVCRSFNTSVELSADASTGSLNIFNTVVELLTVNASTRLRVELLVVNAFAGSHDLISVLSHALGARPLFAPN